MSVLSPLLMSLRNKRDNIIIDNIDSIKIIALCGNKGSGKSTFSELFYEFLKNESINNVHIVKLSIAGWLKYLSYKYFGMIFEKDLKYLDLWRFLYSGSDFINDTEIYINQVNKADYETVARYMFFIYRGLLSRYKDILNVLHESIFKNLDQELLSISKEILKRESGKDFKESRYALFTDYISDKDVQYMTVFTTKYADVLREVYDSIRDVNVRRFLQLMGTEITKPLLLEDYWIVVLLLTVLKYIITLNNKLTTKNKLIIFIDDLRFIVEYVYLEYIFQDALLDSINHTTRISVDTYGIIDVVNDRGKNKDNHRSELEVHKTMKYIDKIIENDKKGLKSFEPYYREILKSL